MNAPTLLSVETLVEAVKCLSDQERREFRDRMSEVWADEGGDTSVILSAEWMAELHRRAADEDAGLTETYDLDGVLNEARESLRRPA
jgi:hypothetical protein